MEQMTLFNSVNDKISKKVEKILRSHIRPNIPSFYKEIISADYVDKRTIVATILLFDDELAELQLQQWSKDFDDAWGSQWLKLESPFNWNGSQWERVKEVIN